MAFTLLFTFMSCLDDDDDDDADTTDTTSSFTTYINGYVAVDLGLSVKWATCNVGADSPSDYGNYYAWGETETKDRYNSNTNEIYAVKMNDFSGNAEYDAATANWGSEWRMPTNAEMKELVDSCTWKWTKQNEVNGYLVIGTNGSRIFLPAAGTYIEASLYDAGENGYFWSSTPSTSSDQHYAYCLYFNNGLYRTEKSYRYCGFPVRPVAE